MNYTPINDTFFFFDQFVFRTTLLPHKLDLISQDKKNQYLKIFSSKVFKESIYLSSPSLYNEYLKFIKGSIVSEKQKERIFFSLYKYYIRIQTRCTPFGLFAGCGIGEWGTKSRITTNEYYRYSRLDSTVLQEILNFLAKDSLFCSHLKYYPNNSIYSIGDKLRYIESKTIGEKLHYQISSVSNNIYLSRIINFSAKGVTISELTNFLLNENVSQIEAEFYIQELIKEQILIIEIEPRITGNNSLDELLEIFSSIELPSHNTKKIISAIYKINQQLKNVDNKIGNGISVYNKIENELKLFSSNLKSRNLLHTDLFVKTSNNTLGRDIQQDLKTTINFLNKIFPPQNSERLEKFLKSFENRYEGAEVPLLQALDVENGIDYIGFQSNELNHLLEDITFSNKTKQNHTFKYDSAEEVIFRKIQQSIKSSNSTVKLFDEDFKTINHTSKNIPPVMHVFFNIVNKNSNKIYLQYCGNSISLIGRFASGSPEILKLAKNLAEHEQNLHPNKITAEIVYLQKNRANNILLRPTLRKYEISCLTRPSVEQNYQISLKDLTLQIVDGRIILRSKKLNKEIIPRLSSAHNYNTTSLPIYSFLCDLQTQYYDKSSINFEIGSIHNLLPYTPRIEYNNVILSASRWTLHKSDFDILFKKENSDFFNSLNIWKNEWSIPRMVCLTEGDNELVVDFEDTNSIKMFLKTIKNRKTIFLTEYLFDKKNALIFDSKSNAYPNECIAFFSQLECKPSIKSQKKIEQNSERRMSRINKNNFLPGEEWVYFKIYTGVKTTDKLITEVLCSFIKDLKNKKIIDKWFFIRYLDPENHIRLRLELSNEKYLGYVLNLASKFFRSFLEMNLISKVKTDTYIRETDRYGYHSIEIIEKIFEIDSDSCMKLVLLRKNTTKKEISWLYALKCIDDYFELFNLKINEILFITDSLFNSFFREHGGDKNLQVQLDLKYRKNKELIYDILNQRTENITEIYSVLLERKISIMKHMVNLNKIRTYYLDEPNIISLISSLIHMTVNRIFSSRQRNNELVLYHFLNEYYKSKLVQINK